MKHFSYFPNKRTFCHRLTSSLLFYIYTAIFFPVLIFTNAELWIFGMDLFCKWKRFCFNMHRKIWNNILIFDFACYFFFAKNLKICKIAEFHRRKILWHEKKGVRISILFVSHISSAPLLVSKTTFTHTLKFWSPLNLPSKTCPPL